MTLNEAIKRMENKANSMKLRAEALDDVPGIHRDKEEIKRCELEAEEYMQIAIWLDDYRQMLEQED